MVVAGQGTPHVMIGATPLEASSRQTVLVTGGAGYIGSLLVRRLLNRGYQVRVLDRLMYGDEPIRTVLGHPRLELLARDFRSEAVLAEAVRGVDAVIHLGAIVGDAACALDDAFTVETNVDATRSIADACRGAGIARMIFASTCSVYGASDDELDERSPLNPVSLYAETKITAEQVLLARQDAHFRPTLLRFATAYGVSHRPRFDLVVNLLSAKAITEGQITIHGGDQWRPFIHVDDIARALIMALEAPLDKVGGRTLNVGSNEQNYRLSEVGQVIQQLIPTARVVTDSNIVDRRNYYVRFDAIRRLLGFNPVRALRDGVIELTSACESSIVFPYSDHSYSNHLLLMRLMPQLRRMIEMPPVEMPPTWAANEAAPLVAIAAGDD